MATLRKRGPYQWEAQVRRRGWPAQSKTFESRAEAEAWAQMIESEMARGVWLDRGELDKIIDRAADLAGGGRQTSTAPYPREGDHRSDRDRDHHGRSGRRRKEGFLGDLFDF